MTTTVFDFNGGTVGATIEFPGWGPVSTSPLKYMTNPSGTGLVAGNGTQQPQSYHYFTPEVTMPTEYNKILYTYWYSAPGVKDANPIYKTWKAAQISGTTIEDAAAALWALYPSDVPAPYYVPPKFNAASLSFFVAADSNSYSQYLLDNLQINVGSTVRFYLNGVWTGIEVNRGVWTTVSLTVDSGGLVTFQLPTGYVSAAMTGLELPSRLFVATHYRTTVTPPRRSYVDDLVIDWEESTLTLLAPQTYGRGRILVNPDGATLEDRWRFADG